MTKKKHFENCGRTDGRTDGRTTDATPWHKLIGSFGPDELKICRWPDLPYKFFTIDCYVIIGKPDCLLPFSHRFLDSDASIPKLNCNPGCLLIHLNIVIQHRYQSSKKKNNWSSTMLNNVFKSLLIRKLIKIKFVRRLTWHLLCPTACTSWHSLLMIDSPPSCLASSCIITSA